MNQIQCPNCGMFKDITYYAKGDLLGSMVIVTGVGALMAIAGWAGRSSFSAGLSIFLLLAGNLLFVVVGLVSISRSRRDLTTRYQCLNCGKIWEDPN